MPVLYKTYPTSLGVARGLLRQLRLTGSSQLARDTGALIPLRDLQDRAKWIAGRPVPVHAAFGDGIAVLSMATVRSQHLRWDGSQGCEHWSFCLEAALAA